MTRFHSSASTRWIGPPPATPAALTMPSMRPCSATSASTNAATALSSPTSRAPTPSAGTRSAPTAMPPSSRTRSTVAAPMPDAAPVTRTTLPLSIALQSFHEVRPVLRDPSSAAVGARQRTAGVSQHDRAGGRGRAIRLGYAVDGRAPLPRGVLALFEPGDPLRGDRGEDGTHPLGLRRAAHAQALQPSRAYGRVGGGARPDLQRA